MISCFTGNYSMAGHSQSVNLFCVGILKDFVFMVSKTRDGIKI